MCLASSHRPMTPHRSHRFPHAARRATHGCRQPPSRQATPHSRRSGSTPVNRLMEESKSAPAIHGRRQCGRGSCLTCHSAVTDLGGALLADVAPRRTPLGRSQLQHSRCVRDGFAQFVEMRTCLRLGGRVQGGSLILYVSVQGLRLSLDECASR